MTNRNKMTARFPQIAARVWNTPLLLDPNKLDPIISVLAPRIGLDVEMPEAQVVEAGYVNVIDQHLEYMAVLEAQGMSVKYIEDGGYYLVNGQTALVPVLGTLIQRGDWMSEMSGMTSYGRVGRMLDAAANDRKVKHIVLEVDSPGGEVAGAFDLADKIYHMRGDKPITAVASEKALSAGYLIASSADEVVLPRTGNLGSIGVVMKHLDMSGALAKRGIGVTLLYAGEKKVDGHPFGPLDERVTGELMDKIKDVYGLFVDTTARNLDIGADRVRGTEAGTFMGMKAVDSGLAHRVNTLSNELMNSALRTGGRLSDRLRASSSTDMEVDMSNQTGGGNQQTITAEDVTRARAEGHTAGRAEAEAASVSAVTAARAEAVTAERTRMRAILTHAEATGRETLAHHLAFNTEMAAEAAGEMLKNAPKVSAEQAKSPLAQAMAHSGSPGVRQQEAADEVKQTAAVNPSNVYASRKSQADRFRV